MTRKQRVARAGALAVLGLSLVGSWGLVAKGGLAGAISWLMIIGLLPWLGGFGLLSIGAYAALNQRLSGRARVALGLSAALLMPGIWLLGIAPVAYPASIDASHPSASVRLPSSETMRVAWGGDEVETNYHALYPDQRWAYDLLIEPFATGSSELTDYGCFGTMVVSPAQATVRVAHDGEPDVPPGAPSNATRPYGNYVALQLETGTFLIIAHLQRESLQVKAGQTVSEGDPLARCGNSGNTSEPHIHIHHQRQDPQRYGPGIGEGLPLFFRGHDGPPMPKGGMVKEGDSYRALGATVRHGGVKPLPSEASCPTGGVSD